MRASQTPENKARLKSETESVVRDLGAFGLPWVLIERADGEKACFFGSDRMEAIANWYVLFAWPILIMFTDIDRRGLAQVG